MMFHESRWISESASGVPLASGQCRPAGECNPVGFFAHLDAKERPLVRFVVRFSRHPAAHWFTSLVNRLGNGWLYGFVLIALVVLETDRAFRPALAASCSLAVAFACYLWIKPRLGRLRPCDSDPEADASIAPLDKYSFPSGHTMSATAVALPLLLSFPGAQPLVLLGAGLIAWSRMACGHHYLTDVLAGAALGIAVALPVCLLIL